jgi:uncharacterized protein YprB with RNaseH-like and TPR domain
MDFINKLKNQINENELEKNKNKIKENKKIFKDFDLGEGKIVENDFGNCFLKEKVYNFDYVHGICNFKDLVNLNFKELKKIRNDLDINLNNILFLDTETTGLSSGTGTIAFLIGIGYFKNNYFYLFQYFMRDYDEEFAMLYEINNIIKDYKYMISYNGKAFDWNLLITRFLLNRISIENKDIIHLDLLYISRRIWRKRLVNCKLSTIEKYILKIERIDDIDGQFIPKIYFEYLETNIGNDILKVMDHNKIDILSMITLLKRIIDLSGNPLAESFDWFEIFGIGELYEKNNNKNDALRIYEHCSFSKDAIVKNESQKRLVGLYRHFKDDLNLEKTLQNLLNQSNFPLVKTLVDLAKFYEHRKRDYRLAIEIVNRAIDNVIKFKATRKMYLKDLNHRKNRLEKKLKKNKE